MNNNKTLMYQKRIFGIFCKNPTQEFTTYQINKILDTGNNTSRIKAHIQILLYYNLVMEINKNGQKFYKFAYSEKIRNLYF